MAESGIPERFKAEAYLLPGIGGGVDAIGVLTLGGLFVAHMSGNTAFLGAAFGQGNFAQGLPHLFAVPIFVAGLFLGYSAIVHSPTPRRCACILLVEAALLSVFLVSLTVFGDQTRNSLSYFLIATPPLLAMGLQNATLRQIGRSNFPSTYVTGVLDLLAKSAAVAVVRHGQPGADAAVREVRRAAGVWLSYATGAILGSAGLWVLGAWILVIPITALVAMAGWFLRNQIRNPKF